MPKKQFEWTIQKALAVVALVIVIGVLAYALIASQVSKNDANSDNGQSKAGQHMTVEGEYVCLPKEGPGPHTLECALGLKANDGEYYSLELTKSNGSIANLQPNDRIRVSGVYEPREDEYVSDGIIYVESLQEL